MKNYYTCWLLPPEERLRLLGTIAPMFPDVVAHHVTREFGVSEEQDLPEDAEAFIVGTITDGVMVQAIVVEINGTTQRPDGLTYHITWSLDRSKGAKPVMSNALLLKQRWDACDRVRMPLIPAKFQN